jgi:hypothetical protein
VPIGATDTRGRSAVLISLGDGPAEPRRGTLPAMTTASPVRPDTDAGEGGMSRHAHRCARGLVPAGRAEPTPRHLGAAGGGPAGRHIGGSATTNMQTQAVVQRQERSPTAARRRHRARGARPVASLILAVVLLIAIPVLVLLEVCLLRTLGAF